MIKYFPYTSDEPNKKYYVITNDNKKVYFGAAGYSDFTIHKDEARKLRYIKRQRSRWLLWHLPTINASYQDIKIDLIFNLSYIYNER